MPLAIVYSRATSGIDSPLVTIEVHITYGVPRFFIVGLPETAVKESEHRVESALLQSNFEFPRRRVTINLAPADLPKEGGRFDLPIALGILAASQQIPLDILKQYEFVGELALSGELRLVHGILPIVLGATRSGRCLIVPTDNAPEAALVKEAEVLSAGHLLEVCAFLQGKKELPPCVLSGNASHSSMAPDLLDVRGQPHARRALEIAAAGKHSLLFMGPPGTGKTMLASRMPSILPDLDNQQAVEVATIASVSSQGFQVAEWGRAPFRSPHHSCSSAALAGGGRPPRPGEISLAHGGVLFLDELPEFNRAALESLREPLESGKITISRAAFQSVFPAQFQLLAAMNPCPCGYAGSTLKKCYCTEEQVRRYLRKLSGPLLDRIDMQVEVPSLPPSVLALSASQGEASAIVKSRVLAARAAQHHRQGKCNQVILVNELETVCNLSNDTNALLQKAIQRFNLSARAYHRLLKVARTIADLSSESAVLSAHVSEALTYRCLDRMRAELLEAETH